MHSNPKNHKSPEIVLKYYHEMRSKNIDPDLVTHSFTFSFDFYWFFVFQVTFNILISIFAESGAEMEALGFLKAGQLF